MPMPSKEIGEGHWQTLTDSGLIHTLGSRAHYFSLCSYRAFFFFREKKRVILVMVLHFAFFFSFQKKKKEHCIAATSWHELFSTYFVQYDGLTSAKIFFHTEDPLFFSLFVSWVTKGNFFFLKKKKKDQSPQSPKKYFSAWTIWTHKAEINIVIAWFFWRKKQRSIWHVITALVFFFSSPYHNPVFWPVGSRKRAQNQTVATCFENVLPRKTNSPHPSKWQEKK